MGNFLEFASGSKDQHRISLLRLSISFLLRLSRSVGGGRWILGRFRLVSNSFDIHNVDQVISNIASAIDL